MLFSFAFFNGGRGRGVTGYEKNLAQTSLTPWMISKYTLKISVSKQLEVKVNKRVFLPGNFIKYCLLLFPSLHHFTLCKSLF